VSRDRRRARRARPAVWLIAAALALGAHGARAQQLRVGFGVEPLPAAAGESMGGYGGLVTRRADGVLDPPEARALVLERGELRVAIAALDIVIARPDLRDAVLEATRPLGIHLLTLIATHTHSGPGGYLPGWLPARLTAGAYDPEMPGRLTRATASAVERAVADLAPARLSAGAFPLQLARNRRFSDGASDHTLALLRADFADGRPPVLVFEYGAHATLLSADNTSLSADWPGAARASLGEAGWRALFLPGPLGDQEPAVDLPLLASHDQEVAAMRDFGHGFARAVDEDARKLEPSPDAAQSLSALERWVEPPTPRIRRFCGLWWLSPFVDSTLDAFVSKRVPIQVVRAGDAELLAVPAEPSAAVGETLRQQDPSGHVRLLLAHANDWLGYVVDPPTYARGGYESCLCLLGPGAAQWLVDASGDTLRQLDARATDPSP
jgi:neutral/alkaline ceramidase-like enzyme